MRLNNFFRVGLGFWLTIISITDCASETRIPLKEEKGYIFSASPIETNVITQGSLSQFEKELDLGILKICRKSGNSNKSN
jgi:hypothetical protein